jgi:hypothetical protein
MKKYDSLGIYLARNNHGIAFTLTFQQIEALMGSALPLTARLRNQRWANEADRDSRHVQCRAWRNAGLRTANVDLRNQTVDFCPEG